MGGDANGRWRWMGGGHKLERDRIEEGLRWVRDVDERGTQK